MSGKIVSLMIKYNGVNVMITASDTKQNDTDTWIHEEDYELYHNIDDSFYRGLVCKEHMSYFNETTKIIESALPIRPKSGFFDEHVNKPLLGVDTRKAYTFDFTHIKYYPIFNHFDVWRKYADNHKKIDDYNQYIVKVDKNSNPILFSGVFSRCYGYKLNRINEKFEVLYYKKPSNIITVK